MFVAGQAVQKVKVTVTQFGQRGDRDAVAKLGPLDKDSLAVSPDLAQIFPFRSQVYVDGRFLGFRDATPSAKFHRTIAAYNPHSVSWEGDRSGYIEVPLDVTSRAAPALKMDSMFTPNPNLPPDAVELSATEHPDESDYFTTRPKTRPPNVPPDYMVVRVFHRGKVIGWTYISKQGLALLHRPKKT
jgi:hypothetical protein